LRNGLVVAEGASEIAVENAFPIADVLRAEWKIEAVGVAGFGDLDRRRAFAEKLLNGISGDDVDEEEDDGDDQPDDWEGVEDALGYSSQLSVLSCQFSVLSYQSWPAKAACLRGLRYGTTEVVPFPIGSFFSSF
jgi:hypothetical protein